jgi:uncharacterized hydantoinase/oxoprolinase family protein
MASTNNIQLSLLVEEADVLKEEANRQMAAVVRKREEVIAKGEKVGNLKQIAASTVATQIIRRALPRLKIEIEKDKKGRLKQ